MASLTRKSGVLSGGSSSKGGFLLMARLIAAGVGRGDAGCCEWGLPHLYRRCGGQQSWVCGDMAPPRPLRLEGWHGALGLGQSWAQSHEWATPTYGCHLTASACSVALS